MIVIYLPPMRSGHGPGPGRDLVEIRPQGFEDLSIQLASSTNEVEAVQDETLGNMRCKMERTDGGGDFQALWQAEKLPFLQPQEEINPPLAADVIGQLGISQALSAIPESIADGIVGIHLSEAGIRWGKMEGQG